MTNTTCDARKKPNQIITDHIIAALNEGIIPWKRPWEALEVMSVDGRPYRGINRMLLSWAGYADARFITFRKCSEMGGHVKQGEKGFPVVLWQTRKPKDADVSEPKKEIPFMRYFIVFNVEQCENLKLKPLAHNTIEFLPIDRAQEIVDGFPDKPAIRHGGTRAAYGPITDTIQIPVPESFHSSEDYYATLFHELIHATGHGTRLNRDLNGYLTAESYSKEELTAEIGSAFLRAEAHIQSAAVEENTVAYIQSWIRVLANDPNMVIQAASKAQKAVDYVLNRHLETAETEVEREQAEEAA